MQRTFDWRPPHNRDHEQRYNVALLEQQTAGPVVIGMPWYEAFDEPILDKERGWFLPDDLDSLGQIRGGHAVCVRPPFMREPSDAYTYYNQGMEGACVGFAVSRAATFQHRVLFAGRPLYLQAQKIDDWPGENYSGTSVMAGMRVLAEQGPYKATPENTRRTYRGPVKKYRAVSYLWANSVEQVHNLALASDEPFIRIVNSWGASYPYEVRMSDKLLAHIIEKGAEIAVPRFV